MIFSVVGKFRRNTGFTSRSLRIIAFSTSVTTKFSKNEVNDNRIVLKVKRVRKILIRDFSDFFEIRFFVCVSFATNKREYTLNVLYNKGGGNYFLQYFCNLI